MTDVHTRQPLGRTGIQVTRLGIGCGRLGSLQDAAAWRLLDVAFAHGVRVVDIARSYGRAEALVGAWRKLNPAKEIVVSTKVGYGVAGVADWTAEAVTRGIEEARTTLYSDVLDVVHLHSCPGHVACRDDIQDALEAARDSGHVAVIGYAGENEDLDQALSSSLYGAVQLSVNLVDQGSRELRLSFMSDAGIGVFAKRALMNAAWTFPLLTSVTEAWPMNATPEFEYRRRLQHLGLEGQPGMADIADVALRFAAFSPGVQTALVGCSSEARLVAAAASVARGPLAPALVAFIEDRWRSRGQGLRGVI